MSGINFGIKLSSKRWQVFKCICLISQIVCHEGKYAMKYFGERPRERNMIELDTHRRQSMLRQKSF